MTPKWKVTIEVELHAVDAASAERCAEGIMPLRAKFIKATAIKILTPEELRKEMKLVQSRDGKLPERDYSCGAAFCDDPACNTHGAKDADGDLLYWKRGGV